MARLNSFDRQGLDVVGARRDVGGGPSERLFDHDALCGEVAGRRCRTSTSCVLSSFSFRPTSWRRIN